MSTSLHQPVMTTLAGKPASRVSRLTASVTGVDAALVTLRVVLGVYMVWYGDQKLLGLLGGSGFGTQHAAAYGYGETAAIVAGLVEFFGGLGLILGLMTPLASAFVIGTLFNVIVIMYPNGLFTAGSGFAYQLLVLVVAAALALSGPGRLSLDSRLSWPALRAWWMGPAAIAVGIAGGFVGLFFSERALG